MFRTLKYCAWLVFGNVLVGCSPCENEVARSIFSPSGEYKAVVFSRSCGTTVGFNTQVSVLRSSDTLPNDGGNILILGGDIPLKVTWLGNSGLSIQNDSSAKIFKQNDSVLGISVAYSK